METAEAVSFPFFSFFLACVSENIKCKSSTPGAFSNLYLLKRDYPTYTHSSARSVLTTGWVDQGQKASLQVSCMEIHPQRESGERKSERVCSLLASNAFNSLFLCPQKRKLPK